MNADVKKASKRNVEEILEEDHLFSLDVSIFRAFSISRRALNLKTRACPSLSEFFKI